MKTEKPRNSLKKIKVLVPARKPARLANAMSCCKTGNPAPVGPVEE